MTLRDRLDFIYALRRDYRQDPGFRPPYMHLLQAMGNPHLHLPPVIHVAGTNGKGSVIAFMRAILEAAGWTAHVYTSPHLVRANERIVLAGHEIGDGLLESLIDEALAACPVAGCPEMGFFEFFTAVAMAAFARNRADILLLETGLGGRLDSTNVIESPLASVITTLSYDHVDMLGNDIESIAGEKAGILKAGCPCIVGPQIYSEGTAILRDRAGMLGSPFYGEGDGWARIRGTDSFSIEAGGRIASGLPAPSLPGPHQFDNAALAVAVLLIQDRFAIPDDAFVTGLKTAIWPARLEKIETGLLPAGWDVWLDGGHNDSAAQALASQVASWQEEDGRDLYIVTGMKAHKDARAFACPLAPLAAGVFCIPLADGYAPEDLAQIWRDSGAKSAHAVSGGPRDDLLRRILENGASGRILVTGSLSLARWVAGQG